MLGLPLPPLLYFHPFILSSFVFIMLGNALLSNCFLFTTLMVSPCLWTMDMSECPPVDSCAMTLKGEEECLWGKRCLNFFCQGCRGNICCLHLTCSQAALDILPRAVLSWHCFKYSSFYCGFETKPNCQTEWNDGKPAPAVCFILSPLRWWQCQDVSLWSSILLSRGSTAGEVLTLRYTSRKDEEVCF